MAAATDHVRQRRKGPLPADLAKLMLLHDEPRAAWRQWCELAGVSLDLTQGVQFSDAALALSGC